MPLMPETLADQDSTELLGGAAGNPWFGDLPAADSMEVERFCAKHELHNLVSAAIQIVQTEMKPERIQLETANDPEGDGEWVVIRTDIRATVDEVLARYAACKNAWLRLAPPSKQGLVCFLYNIL